MGRPGHRPVSAPAAGAATPEKLSFTANWYAQAEHGGFYQAVSAGLYAREGLDVSLKMGGPQVNIMQLPAAGQTDCVMGYDMQTFSAWGQGIHAVAVAAAFQKDPLVLIGHPSVTDRLEDLKGKTLLISPAGYTVQWPWLKARYMLKEEQKRPYTFSIQPFIADRNVVQQGYLSSEPTRELSGGMQMRVSIARSLVTGPQLLLMDKPFDALDEITRNRLDGELLALWHGRGLTVVFVTHSIHEAVFLSTRVVVMAARPGRIVDELLIGEPYPRAPAFRVSTAFSRHAQRLQSSLLRASGEADDSLAGGAPVA